MGKEYIWGEEDSSENSEFVVKDCYGNILHAGDTVMAIKDLPVKWSTPIKQGDKFKNIRLTDSATEIESGKLVLKTEFFKKV